VGHANPTAVSYSGWMLVLDMSHKIVVTPAMESQVRNTIHYYSNYPNCSYVMLISFCGPDYCWFHFVDQITRSRTSSSDAVSWGRLGAGCDLSAGSHHTIRLWLPLICVLLDRWWLETHTFHLPVEEMAATLRTSPSCLGCPVQAKRWGRLTSPSHGVMTSLLDSR
jgi:hypothetical protein